MEHNTDLNDVFSHLTFANNVETYSIEEVETVYQVSCHVVKNILCEKTDNVRLILKQS